jgi:hypothetical protein
MPHILWNPNIYCHVYYSPPLVTALSQMSPIHNLPPYFLRSVLILSGCSWLRHYATSRKVSGSIPDEVIELFQFT